MKYIRIVPIIIVLLITNSCANDGETATNTTDATDSTPKYLTGDSDYIFDQNKLHTFDLVLSEEALATLDADPAAEQYEEGALVFEGDTLSAVGIRYKGNRGAFFGCLSGADPLNPSGYKICNKLSMKVKINWEGRDEKFFKLKKLQFLSMNNDPSQMRDRLGYWLFRQMEVPAPRATHAKLNVNGQYVGLFSLVEQIDKQFIKENYDDDDGNLYKEAWPHNPAGVPYSDQVYIDALKTNEDNPDISIMKDLGQSLVAAVDMTENQEVVEKFLDMNEIISYAVVDRAIRHDDGPFHWYCFTPECFNQNYYWYEEPNEEKLHLIAWDLDHSFENIISDTHIATPIKDGWGEITNNCEPFLYPEIFTQRSAACDKLTGTWSSDKYLGLYDQKKIELSNGPMSNGDEMINLWQAQIREATEEASELHDDAVTPEEWDAKVIEIKQQLDHARNN